MEDNIIRIGVWRGASLCPSGPSGPCRCYGRSFDRLARDHAAQDCCQTGELWATRDATIGDENCVIVQRQQHQQQAAAASGFLNARVGAYTQIHANKQTDKRTWTVGIVEAAYKRCSSKEILLCFLVDQITATLYWLEQLMLEWNSNILWLVYQLVVNREHNWPPSTNTGNC